ncbi:hypothetical protein INT45_003381 [Circinella minor]|uniref:DASH complex subunit DAD2 n=1 Tax=Circinella minor TaxID=1195481 RepID=A0A8H7VKM3_9FUNG|nr:hypothetical protein INT45_003381 [Circinella minor]
MQRGSTGPQRSQLLSTSGHAPKQTDQRSQVIREKEQEFRELSNIKKQSAQLVQFFEELQKDMHILSQGVQGTADTLENWNHVFRIMASTKGDEDNNDDTSDQEPLFVRLPINDPNNTTTITQSPQQPSSSSTINPTVTSNTQHRHP